MKNKKIVSYTPRGKTSFNIDGTNVTTKFMPNDGANKKSNRKFLASGAHSRTAFNESFSGLGDSDRSLFDNFYHPSYGPDLYNEPWSLQEERELIRYLYERDPYVGHGIDLLTELPISFVHHTQPVTTDPQKAFEVLRFIKSTSNKLDMFQLLMDISLEYWLFSNVFIYVEKNLSQTDIERVILLNPNFVEMQHYSGMSYPVCFFVPDRNMRDLISRSFIDREASREIQAIPEDLQKAIYDNKKIELNTNPYDGSFVKHLTYHKHSYFSYGVPLLRRCIRDLFLRDRLRQAQVKISMRSMEPKHLVSTTAPLDEAEMDYLRDQVDTAMNTPDFALITTYDVKWEVISAQDRLLQLQSEYDEFSNRLSAGLGLKKEILFGGGVYGDSKLGLDLLDKRFSLFRNSLKNFIEKDLWAPICLRNGFIEESEDYQTILTPSLSFTRLSIRDDETIFANLFSLYQDGVISARTILDLYNIDPDSEMAYLENDLFTARDNKFSEFKSSLFSSLGQKLGENVELAKIIAKEGLNLENLDFSNLENMGSTFSKISKKLTGEVLKSSLSDSKQVEKGIYLLGKNDKRRIGAMDFQHLNNLNNLLKK